VSSVIDLVAEGVDKSRKQLLLAASEEWDDFLLLEASRQQLLRSINVGSVTLSEADSALLYKKMTTLIELNEQVESICLQRRSELAVNLKKIRVGSKVSKAYSQ
jgi:hypothetical protein